MKLLSRMADLIGHTIRAVQENKGLIVIVTDAHSAIVINENREEDKIMSSFGDVAVWSDQNRTTEVFDLLRDYKVISRIAHEAATETINEKIRSDILAGKHRQREHEQLLQEQASRVKDSKRKEYARKGMLGKEPWRYE